MALGALIGAYQEDDAGGLRALLPLAGRTLIEYQARCAAAAGAAPVIILVERIPSALADAMDRLRSEGIGVIPVSDSAEAASRFEPGEMILLMADGLAPSVDLLTALVDEQEPTILTVPDDEEHERFERIDASNRWAGIALVEGRTLSSTAAMLGDWDLQSTLLRRSLQGGAHCLPLSPESPEPLLVDDAQSLSGFERQLITASRRVRTDVPSRFLLPLVEEFAIERLMETRVKPGTLLQLTLALTIGAAFAFTRGWHWPALAMLIVSSPLDLVAQRLATLRLRPLPASMLVRRLIWPAAGIALIALGWWESRHGGGWGALFAAVTAAALAEAFRIERGNAEVPGRIWLFSRRNAILLAIPFAIAGAWTAALPALAAYAAVSFFFVQHWNHRFRVN